MLHLMNGILTQAPEFNKTGLVGFPINAILNWAMGTPAGAAAFLNDKVNAQLKKILNQWAVFLRSPDSRTVLNDDPEKGWFGRDALAAMPGFAQDFESDPSAAVSRLCVLGRFFHPALPRGPPPRREPGRRPRDRQCLRVGTLQARRRCAAARPVLDQGPALLACAHAGGRPARRPSSRAGPSTRRSSAH